MNKTIVPILIVLLLIAVVFTVLRGGSGMVKDTDTRKSQVGGKTSSDINNIETGSPSNVTPEITAGISKKKSFTIEGSNYKFIPSEIKVKKGDTVEIVFKNTGGMHDWVIDEFNVRTNKINSGETETITFLADKAGKYEYYCSVGQHRAMGMKGSLIVTE
jgi:plastocyanin